MDCEHVDSCGFFRKFQNRQSLIWQTMIQQHCVGGDACARRVMINAGKAPPSDDLMPVGVHASKAFLLLP